MIGRNARSCERRSAQRRAEFRSLPFGIFIFFLIVGSACPSHAESERTTFFLSNEFYGPRGYSYPEVGWNFDNGMANMLALWPPADAGMFNVITSRNTGFNLYMQGASHVKGDSAATIASQSQSAAGICASAGKDKSLWSLMIEWDQGGGAWVPNGRPRYLGLTRTQAYSHFTGYYLNNSPPLGTYLAQPTAERGCRLASVSHAPNAFYAFHMGVDVGLLERVIDELGDTSTGLAFMRGAGRLYGRPWGIDISLWRTSADSATEFNSSGRLIGGWSPSYVRRHLYVAYMGGTYHSDGASGVLPPRHQPAQPLRPDDEGLRQLLADTPFRCRCARFPHGPDAGLPQRVRYQAWAV